MGPGCYDCLHLESEMVACFFRRFHLEMVRSDRGSYLAVSDPAASTSVFDLYWVNHRPERVRHPETLGQWCRAPARPELIQDPRELRHLAEPALAPGVRFRLWCRI